MKKWMIYLLPVLLLACGSNEESNTTEGTEGENTIQQGQANCQIKGVITGAINQPLILEVNGPEGTLELGRVAIAESGQFEINANLNGFGMYQLKLGVGAEKVLPLTIEPGDHIEIQTNFNDFEHRPTIKGTKWSKPLTEYLAKFYNFGQQQTQLAQDKTLTQDQQIAKFLKMREPLETYAREHIARDPSNPVNLVLYTAITPSMGYEYWDESNATVIRQMKDAYLKTYKNSPIARSLEQQYIEISKGFEDYKASFSGTVEAPEIALPDLEGRTIKLSSLRGKVVLIDFWASWCAPCRKENPNVVRMYNMYKNKGFTVYSVSLDEDAAAWRRAITADGLLWPNHVSDLKGWQTPLVQTYGFNGIPFTVLVNKNGKIIGKNLRGEKLEQKLKEVL